MIHNQTNYTSSKHHSMTSEYVYRITPKTKQIALLMPIHSPILSILPSYNHRNNPKHLISLVTIKRKVSCVRLDKAIITTICGVHISSRVCLCDCTLANSYNLFCSFNSHVIILVVSCDAIHHHRFQRLCYQ